MSKCISSHGEYSEHQGNGEYCDWCGDCNHEAIRRNAKIEALRDAVTAIEKNQIMTQVGHLQPCNSCMVIHMDFLDYRADRLEGDDE